MGIFDNVKVGTGVLVGVGSILLLPIVLPVAATLIKPVAKAALKSGILLYQKSKQAVAETAEMFGDLTAEVHAEIANEAGIVTGAADVEEAAEFGTASDAS